MIIVFFLRKKLENEIIKRKREVEVCVIIRSHMKVGGGPRMEVAQFLNCHYDIHDFAVIQFYMFKVVHLVWTFWTFSTASKS